MTAASEGYFPGTLTLLVLPCSYNTYLVSYYKFQGICHPNRSAVLKVLFGEFAIGSKGGTGTAGHRFATAAAQTVAIATDGDCQARRRYWRHHHPSPAPLGHPSPRLPSPRRLDRSSLRAVTSLLPPPWPGSRSTITTIATTTGATSVTTSTATDATDIVVVDDAAVAVCLRCPSLIAVAFRCCLMSVSEIDDPYATSQTGHDRKPRTKKAWQVRQGHSNNITNTATTAATIIPTAESTEGGKITRKGPSVFHRTITYQRRAHEPLILTPGFGAARHRPWKHLRENIGRRNHRLKPPSPPP